MILSKRTLAWALCALVGSAAAAADEPQVPGPEAAGGTLAAEGEVEPLADPEAIPDVAAVEPTAEASGALAAEALPATDGDAVMGGDATMGDDASSGAADALAIPGATAPVLADPELANAAPGDDGGPAVEAELPESSPGVETGAPPALGAIAYDSEGRQGRIHIVVAGDTLWDISNTYLGTPWVWPSIWKDNGEIQNPHLIHPGDRIWITPTEMRRISAEEADVLLSNAPQAEPAEPAAFDEAVPLAEDVAPPEAPLAARPEAKTYPVSARETAGLITPEQMTSAASVVGGVPERVFMSQEDEVYIGLGESEVEPGDEFTLFRTNNKVFDPDTGELLGYHVDFLGWVRVEKTFPETSMASIRMSTGEIEAGDRVMPRQPLPQEVEIQSAPTGIEGKITFFPNHRVLMGFQDFVYLNRGSLDGLEVGSPLEVFRPRYRAPEKARQESVEVPDRVIAKLLVVRAETDSAVAIVTSTEGELSLGDRFRGATE